MESTFTFVKDDPFYRIQKAIGCIPERTLGIGRRILLFICVGWLPAMIFAANDRLVLGRIPVEPVLAHFDVHVRFLIAIPLFLLAEATAELIIPSHLMYFVSSGIVSGPAVARFRGIVRSAERMKNSWVGFAVVVAVTAAAVFKNARNVLSNDDLSWAVIGHEMSAAGWWYIYVSASLFMLILAVWAWRFLVLLILMVRVTRLDLQLMPTHPDRAAGLGFLGEVPLALSPLILAFSSVIAARHGHMVAYHGLQVYSLNFLAATVCAIALLLFVGPLLIFYPKLRVLKPKALMEYGDLVYRHGRLVEEKWIHGKPVEDESLLQAPELGPSVDVNSVYQSVEQMRFAPFNMRTVVVIAISALLPFLPVYALQIPIRDIVLKIVESLL